MSFNHRSSIDTDMFTSPKILICVALVYAATVSANGRNQRSNFIDLGTSVLLPWESANNDGLRNAVYNREQNSESLSLRSLDNQNQNERNELQQRLKNLGRLSNEIANREQYLVRGDINSESQRQSWNAIGQNERQRQGQNGYTGLGSYSTFNAEQEQNLEDQTRQRQIQYLNQLKNQLTAQVLRNEESRRLNEVASSLQNGRLESLRPSNEAEIRGQAAALNNRWSKNNRLSNLRNGQDSALSGRQVQYDGVWNQQNSGRTNQVSSEQVNIQQRIPNIIRGLHYGDNRGQLEQLRIPSRSLNNQQIYRTISPDAEQRILGENTIGQQPRVSLQYGQEPIEQIRGNAEAQAVATNLGGNPESQLNQQVLNQQQPDVYTYGELTAKIWNVIKSNPAMISNLENLSEQLVNERNPGNERMRQLKGLLQAARQYNRNILIPGNGNVEQSPEQQEQNIVISHLIDAMNRNEENRIPSNVRSQIWGSHGGWGVQ